MSRTQALARQALTDPKGTGDLVALLNQSLAETLDLAFQAEQAHWNVKGQNAHELRLVFNHLHGQLATYVDDFDARAVTLCGPNSGYLSPAQRLSSFTPYPLDALDRKVHLNDLVDSCGDYAGRMRKATRKAQKMGHSDTATFYSRVSRDMDETLWMLTEHQET